jgi:hypothetical protein
MLRKINELLHRKPKGTDTLIQMKEIYVPKTYRRTPPRFDKMIKFRKFYYKHGYVDKPILVKEKNEFGRYDLVDHYGRYLVLKELGVEIAPIHYIHNI